MATHHEETPRLAASLIRDLQRQSEHQRHATDDFPFLHRGWPRIVSWCLVILGLLYAVPQAYFLRQEHNALLTRVAKLEKLPDPPTVEETQHWEASARAATESQERRDEAITTCRRQLGQVAVMGFGYRVVCIQAPSVAFEIDPDWPVQP